jgi:ankyrin repeat protein
MDLIARGVPPRLTCFDGQTPLHIAAERGHMEMVRFLVGYGTHVDAPDKRGRRPIILALDEDHKAVVEYLLQEGAVVDLCIAAYLGDVGKVKELIESGKGNVKGKDGNSAMHHAVSQGHRKVVELLVAAGADIGSLHTAVESGRLEMVELLIDKGADANGRSWRRDTPLLKASDDGRLDIVKLLLTRGANPNVSSQEGDMGCLPLHAAMKNGHIEIVEALIAGGADPKAADWLGWSLLHEAVTDFGVWSERGRPLLSMIELLVAHGVDVNVKDKEGLTPLHCAAYEGYEDIAALLLARGADVNARTASDPRPDSIPWERDLGFRLGPSVTPLHEAVAGWDPNVVGLLLAHGAEVNASDESGDTPLHYAAARTGRKVAEVLIAAGADVNARNKDGTTPLAIALRRGNVETARALIAAEAQKVVMKNRSPRIRVEYESKHEAVLHLAIAGRSEMPWRQVPSDAEPNVAEFRREWVELLLANGADPNERDEEGNTALSAALLRGDERLARLLIAHGCDVNACNPGGTTALHLAAAGGRGELISLLLAKGADVNAQDVDGDTPLHSAALRGHRKAVELLLSHKADPNLRNSRGRTPRDEAARRGHTDVVQLLTAKPRPSKEGEK